MGAKPGDSNRLPFETDERTDPTLGTAHAGVPLLIELFRKVEAAVVVDEQVVLEQRRRCLTSSQMVESAVAPWASGGERVSDLGVLREDAALAALVGLRLPAANTMRDFLEAFHEEDLRLWQAAERNGLQLIRWHRGKAGRVEHTHHVLKNELAVEALPSGHIPYLGMCPSNKYTLLFSLWRPWFILCNLHHLLRKVVLGKLP